MPRWVGPVFHNKPLQSRPLKAKTQLFNVVALLSFICFGSYSSHAVLYQVGPNRPYTQLSQVAGLLNPGDVVEVDGNATYGYVVFDRPGTAAQPIIIRGMRVNGMRPILSGESPTTGITLHMRTNYGGHMGHYLVEGFEITGGSQMCVRNQAHDVTYRDIKVYNCARHGLLSHDWESGNLTISHAEFTGIGGVYANENFKHPIYITTSQNRYPGSTCRIEYSYIHDNVSGNNIKSRCERNEIYYNWIEGAFIYELELIGPEETGTGRQDHSDVVGNVIYGHNRNTPVVIRMGTDGTGEESRGRYRFVNNTIITTGGAGASISRSFGAIESVEFINNVLYDLSGGNMRLHRAEPSWSGGTAWVNGEVCTGHHNWIGNNLVMGFPLSACANVLNDTNGTVRGIDPGFTITPGPNFNPRPLSTSGLINGGTSSNSGSNSYPLPNPLISVQYVPPVRGSSEFMTLTPTLRSILGGSIDIGAFEATSGGTPPPPTASACDINSNGSTNVTDVQLCANQAIGVSACTTGDIDDNNQCNVVDVQRVVNAALGGQCVTQ